MNLLLELGVMVVMTMEPAHDLYLFSVLPMINLISQMKSLVFEL